MIEAIGYPLGMMVVTMIELPPILLRMWKWSLNASWIDFVNVLKTAGTDPRGRDKFLTAGGYVGSYANDIGDKAFCRVGHNYSDTYQIVIYDFTLGTKVDFEIFIGTTFVREQFEAEIRGHSRKPRLGFFLPEGQLTHGREVEVFQRGNLPFTDRIYTMSSSMGIGIITACQAASRMSPYVLNNSNIQFVFRQDGLEDAKFWADRLGLDKIAGVIDLMGLPPGIYYVRAPGWEKAVKLQATEIKPKRSPSREELEARFKADHEFLRSKAVYASPADTLSPIDWVSITDGKDNAGSASGSAPGPVPSPSLLDDHYALMQSIQANPTDGLAAHYDRQGWSRDKGNRILAELTKAGAVVVNKVPSSDPRGGRSRLVASLTAKGAEWLTNR